MAKYWVLDGHGWQVKTQLDFRSYLCGLGRCITGHRQVRFLNTSRAGAMIVGFSSRVHAMIRAELFLSRSHPGAGLFRLGRGIEAASWSIFDELQPSIAKTAPALQQEWAQLLVQILYWQDAQNWWE